MDLHLADILDRETAVLELEALELVLRKRKYRRLRAFIEDAWPIVEPSHPFVSNWHIDTLCAVLEQVSLGKIKRLVINVPPGTMKSLLMTFWTAWEWAKDPELRSLTASYNYTRSIDNNAKLRQILQSPWYQEHFDTQLRGDAKEHIETTKGGWRIATSIGGPGTGLHPDRIIIDDPTTATEALSDQVRTTANTWFDRTISMRGVTRNVVIVLIMQRLHEDDLAGHLLARGGWNHICFPMRFDAEHADPLDRRTTPGELLWPELFSDDKVREAELTLGPYGAAGQLQQRPAPEGGGLFKRGWFEIVDAVPAGARRIRGWDTAGTEDGGDYTAGVRMAEHRGVFYIEDVYHDRVGPAGVDAAILACAQLDGRTCGQREEKEGGASGKAVIAARAKLLVGYDYSGVEISGDKVTRAKPYRAQCEAGNVKLVQGPWNEIYLQELEHFPVGKWDDQVDGSSCAFNALLLEEPANEELTWGS